MGNRLQILTGKQPVDQDEFGCARVRSNGEFRQASNLRMDGMTYKVNASTLGRLHSNGGRLPLRLVFKAPHCSHESHVFLGEPFHLLAQPLHVCFALTSARSLV